MSLIFATKQSLGLKSIITKGVFVRPASISVTKITAEEREKERERQENHRPLSPHLTIYRWSPSMFFSIMHRGTGVFMTGLTSVGAMAIAASPHDSTQIIEALSNITGVLPLLKLSLSFPIFYHASHGTRHLFWDRGFGIENAQSEDKKGFAVVGTAAVASLIASFAF